MFYDHKFRATGKFIVYSRYGLQSHIIQNNNGVIFSCNPKRDENSAAVIFESIELATISKDDFYDAIAEVQFISKYEKDFIQEPH